MLHCSKSCVGSYTARRCISLYAYDCYMREAANCCWLLVGCWLVITSLFKGVRNGRAAEDVKKRSCQATNNKRQLLSCSSHIHTVTYSQQQCRSPQLLLKCSIAHHSPRDTTRTMTSPGTCRRQSGSPACSTRSMFMSHTSASH